MADAAPRAARELPQETACLIERFGTLRRARTLGERLFGLGILRLTEPPASWSDADRDHGVGCPPHLSGFLQGHADADPARAAGAKARTAAEIRMPALREAREAGRLTETTYRLLAVKATPDTIGEWLGTVPDSDDRRGTAAANGLLRLARDPVAIEPAARPAGERPADVRARVAARTTEAAPSMPVPAGDRTPASPPAVTQPPAPMRLDRRVLFDGMGHDAWWQATERVRGETRDTPSPGKVLAAILDHFAGVPERELAAFTLAGIEPGRRIFVDPLEDRAWLQTNGGRLEIPVPHPGDGRLRDPTVVVRRARGQTCAPSPQRLQREFPELFGDTDSDACRRAVRTLLGYPVDRAASEPCPPVPRAPRSPVAPIAEDAVSVSVVARLDPGADALPAISATGTRAITASAGRMDGRIRALEIDTLRALDRAERAGRCGPGTVASLCARHDIDLRARQEMLSVGERMEAMQALRRALDTGMVWSKSRLVGRIAERPTVEAWLSFARPRGITVVAACVRAAAPGDMPPVIPEGMDPLLPLGSKVGVSFHQDLTEAQQRTWTRLWTRLTALHGRAIQEAAFLAAIAGWYVVRRSGLKKQRDAVVYQRSPETRVPIELRRRAAVPRAVEQALGWMWTVPESRRETEWRLPAQRPGQRGTPAAAMQAAFDRDGYRCAAFGCPSNLVLQYNHGRLRRHGAIADLDFDQIVCGPTNVDHSEGRVFIENRPDGGTWAWDRQGRRLGSVAPVGRQLDAAMLALLLTHAQRSLRPPPRPPPAEAG